MDALLTIEQAAEMLHVHPETLRRWDKDGKFPAVIINERGHRRYRGDDIKKFLQSNADLVKYNRPIPVGENSVSWYSEGFTGISGDFGLMAKIISTNGSEVTGFAFVVSGMTKLTSGMTRKDYDELAIETVKKYISEKKINDGDTFTFEFENGDFHEVQDPVWWAGKYGKTLIPKLRVEVSDTSEEKLNEEDVSWRVILRFLSKNESGQWVTATFGKANFFEYYAWISAKRTEICTPKAAQVLAIDYIINRFDETKDADGIRSLSGINENTSSFTSGGWEKVHPVKK
jgi:excisionase family DNA binding protein